MCRTAISSLPRSLPASPRPTAWCHASTKAATSPRTMLNMSSSAPSWRRPTRTRISARSPNRSSGSCNGPTPSNGCGPTTTPTSSARCSASCGIRSDPEKPAPDRRETGIWARLRSTQYPHPPYRLGDHVTEREQHRGPHEGRREVRDLEAPERHREDAGDERHRGTQWPEETADEDPGRAPFLHERLALGDQLRMSRQRPNILCRALELQADPVGQPVAERRAERRRNPDRPEIDLAGRDQSAHADQS